MTDRVKYATAPFKEPDFERKRRKHELWCSYCGEWRHFKQGQYGNYRCEACTISTADFWIRRANKLWDSDKPKDAGINKPRREVIE